VFDGEKYPTGVVEFSSSGSTEIVPSGCWYQTAIRGLFIHLWRLRQHGGWGQQFSCGTINQPV